MTTRKKKTRTMQITLPLDPTTPEGWEMCAALLDHGLTTPEILADALSDHCSLIDQCLVRDDSPRYADDGTAEVEYDGHMSGEEAAMECVSSGDWGDASGSVDVYTCRLGLDASGDQCSVEEEWHNVDIPIPHDRLTQE